MQTNGTNNQHNISTPKKVKHCFGRGLQHVLTLLFIRLLDFLDLAALPLIKRRFGPLSKVSCRYLECFVHSGWLPGRSSDILCHAAVWLWRRCLWWVCFRSRRETQTEQSQRSVGELQHLQAGRVQWVTYLTCCGSCGSWRGVRQPEQPSGRALLPGRCRKPPEPAGGRSHPAGRGCSPGHPASKDKDGYLMSRFYINGTSWEVNNQRDKSFSCLCTNSFTFVMFSWNISDSIQVQQVSLFISL